jgi:hypothetical protein
VNDNARGASESYKNPAISLIVRERSNRWWVVFATTSLLRLGPEVTTGGEALRTARALYPGFNVELE